MGRVLRLIYRNLEEWGLVLCLVGMVVLMGLQVLCRHAFGSSLSFTEEITRYLFIWSAFLSIGMCTKRAMSIRVDLLLNMLPKRGRALLKIFNLTLEGAFFIYLIPFAYRYLSSTIESGQTSPACSLPMWIVQAAPLVCFSLTVVRIAERWFLQWRNFLSDTEFHSWEDLRKHNGA